jgi:hypothetical protein
VVIPCPECRRELFDDLVDDLDPPIECPNCGWTSGNKHDTDAADDPLTRYESVDGPPTDVVTLIESGHDHDPPTEDGNNRWRQTPPASCPLLPLSLVRRHPTRNARSPLFPLMTFAGARWPPPTPSSLIPDTPLRPYWVYWPECCVLPSRLISRDFGVRIQPFLRWNATGDYYD